MENVYVFLFYRKYHGPIMLIFTGLKNACFQLIGLTIAPSKADILSVRICQDGRKQGVQELLAPFNAITGFDLKLSLVLEQLPGDGVCDFGFLVIDLDGPFGALAVGTNKAESVSQKNIAASDSLRCKALKHEPGSVKPHLRFASTVIAYEVRQCI